MNSKLISILVVFGITLSILTLFQWGKDQDQNSQSIVQDYSATILTGNNTNTLSSFTQIQKPINKTLPSTTVTSSPSQSISMHEPKIDSTPKADTVSSTGTPSPNTTFIPTPIVTITPTISPPPSNSTVTPVSSVTPSSTPTPQQKTETPTPSISPSITPTPTSIPKPIIVIASLTNPVKQKEDGILSINVPNDSVCNIQVTLPSGSVSTSKKLVQQTATNGFVMWKWPITWNTKTGTATIDLSCTTPDNQELTKVTTMEILPFD